MTEAGAVAAQVVGTVTLRPYVVAFLATYLVIATRDLGARRAAAWLGWGWLVAFVAEYASTRIGFPFGLYHYTGHTVGQEVFVANVPVFSPLSFPFLSYAAWCLVRSAGGRSRAWTTVLAGGVLMMLLDVVIDPIAVMGDRWFLGEIFVYPEPGWYFGVPLTNFAGWVLVGWVIMGGLALTGFAGIPGRVRGTPTAGAALYYAILLFNLAITLWIGDVLLFAVGAVLHAALAVMLWGVRHGVRGPAARAFAGHLEPAGAAAAKGSVDR